MCILVEKSKSFDHVNRKFLKVTERLGSLQSAPLSEVIVPWTQSTHEDSRHSERNKLN